MTIYACIVAGLMVGVPYAPQAGRTIAQDQPGMTCWHDATSALAASPSAVAGWSATLAADGSVAMFTAPPAAVVVQTPPTSVAVTSTAVPGLSGTYGITATDLLNITGITAGINAGKGFPNGQGTLTYVGSDGTVHVFASTSEFTAFAYAVEGYVADLQLAGLGQKVTLPTLPLQIP